MKQKTINRSFICSLVVLAGVFLLFFGAFGNSVARAASEPAIVISDNETGFGISTIGPFNGCADSTIFSCQFGPPFQEYTASSSFSISKMMFHWQNSGANNCVGVGNYGAIITTDATRNTVIATSSNTIYLGCGGGSVRPGELDFNGQNIPAHFYLSFGAFDGGVQGGSAIWLGNLAIYASAEAREPVVIVPGIMGSRLVASSTGDEVWPNVSKMIASPSDDYLDVLKLGADGKPAQGSTPIYPSDIVRNATGTFLGIPVGSDFYSGLINSFIQDGYQEGKDLFVAPYDWRLDIDSQTDVLAAKISAAQAASPTGKINIIAHSMGGLLVKKYLDGLSDASVVDKVILVGVPELGAPKGFSILNYGDDLGLSWLGIFGLNSGEVKSITQNMPSAYQLLPSRKYVQVAGPYVQDFRSGNADQLLSYDRTASFMTGNASDSRNASLLGLADAFHQVTDARPVNAPHVYNIVGCSVPTITGFNVYDDGAVDVNRGNGDGVVPAVSTMNLADGYTNYFVLGDRISIDHMGLVQDPHALALIAGIINNAPAGTALPDGISTASVDCFDPDSVTSGSLDDTAYEFSAHQAATLDVYDAANRHTGINASGDIETNIPGSTYEAIGQNTFVTVPAVSTYKVDVYGGTSKKTTVKIKGYKGSALKQVVAYPPVLLASSSSKAEVSFSSFNSEMGLIISGGATGTINSVLQPLAILTASSSTTDVVPPVITAQNIVSQIAQNATATISWNVSDVGSGVATTTATFNGATIANGQLIVFKQSGDNVLFITAMDNAGNFATKEVHVAVTIPPATPTSTSKVKTALIPITIVPLHDPRRHRDVRIQFKVSSSTLRAVLTSGTKLISAKLTLGIKTFNVTQDIKELLSCRTANNTWILKRTQEWRPALINPTLTITYQ